MWDLLQQQSFLLGVALVLICQAAKFSQLDLADPITSHYVGFLPGAKVQDFAGYYAYHFALAAFLVVSVIAYYLLCLLSPEIWEGAIKLFAGVDPSKPSAAKAPESGELAKKVAKVNDLVPLYVAAAFIGATQPIRWFSWAGDVQRNFFHRRIDVPRRVIDLSGNLTSAIEARAGTSKQQLADEVRKLAGTEFQRNLQSYGDAAFYRLQLDKLQIDSEEALDRTIRESSLRELRALLERLMLYALVAAMRRSGPRSLGKVSELVGVKGLMFSERERGYFVAGFMASGVLFAMALLVIGIAFAWLDTRIPKAFGQHPTLWPASLSDIGWEFVAIVPPMVVSLVVAISLLAPRHQRPQARARAAVSGASMGIEFIEFVRSAAPVLGICIGVAALVKFGLMFRELNAFVGSTSPSMSILIFPLIQSFIPATLCLFTAWYLVSAGNNGSRQAPSFWMGLLLVAVGIGLVAFLYSQAFVLHLGHKDPALKPSWDYVVFIVIANVSISIAAFASVAAFFKTRDGLVQAVHRRHERRATDTRESNHSRRPVKNIISRVHARVRTGTRARGRSEAS